MEAECIADINNDGDGKISDSVIGTILLCFSRQLEDELRNHLFSERVFPISVNIKTVYPGCAQEITIRFRDYKEINNK